MKKIITHEGKECLALFKGVLNMPSTLLFSNVPVDCTDESLRDWLQARGYPVTSIEFIRDVISGTSPCFAYVQLTDSKKLDEAVRKLDGQSMRGHSLCVSRVMHARAGANRARAVS
jgi:RNA recognition motif-containing protein